MARITSVEQLRTVVAQPRATTQAKVLDHLDTQARDFIAASPFLLLSTSDDAGTIEVSPKGDVPGFVEVEDDRTLLIPDRPGNNLAYGLSNLIANCRIGLIFLLPATGETLRLAGHAEVFDDADLLARMSAPGRPALLAIRMHVTRSYFHCARSVLRAGLWRPETWPEKRRVSFGAIIAPRVGGDQAMADQIDTSVEGAYTERLWRNA
jgi:PPOX class probable FMN-dependent enzyme